MHASRLRAPAGRIFFPRQRMTRSITHMAISPAHLSFVPWVRQGTAAAIAVQDTLGSNLRGEAALTANLTINGSAVPPVTLRLRGPADVVGIDPRQIVRMDPLPGSTDFEPNYFPAIEFDRADFPWLFTPARADAQGRLRPWLCLIMVRAQPGVQVGRGDDASLPVLEIAAPARAGDELPDLVECWAWAHAQACSGGDSAADAHAALQGRPEQSLSRLLCPRLLTADTEYIACVVPTFALGVKAGLGQEIKDTDLADANALKPAWTLASIPSGGVRLPLYHHWRFRTGAGGDFESLVRLLRALPAPGDLGSRPIDVSTPGFALPASFPAHATRPLEGALRPLEAAPAPAWVGSDATAFQTALAAIVNAPGVAAVIGPDDDPLLAPPLYGRWYAARNTVARGSALWLDQLNLDPRHRATAAFGTRVVQEHQEALMAAAWEQAAELQRANQRLRQLQLSLAVGTSLHARHVARLGRDAALRLCAPAFGRLRSGVAGALSKTLVDQLHASPLPPKATSVAMRRIGRERGPLTRRVVAQGGVRDAQALWTVKLNADPAATFVSSRWWDVASFGIVRERIAQPTSLRRFAEVGPEIVTNVFGRPVFRIVADGQPVTVQGLSHLPPQADSPTARAFRLAARDHLARVQPGRIGMLFAPPPPLDFEALRTHVQHQLEPKRNLVAATQVMIATAGHVTQAVNPAPAAPVPIETIMAAPKFRRAMYEPLRDLSQELLLPGLDAVQPNSVLGLKTNRSFIEAYMVGLNAEMARELLWRGYPTDQLGTYFDRFWDAVGDAPADILPLHQWGDRALGSAAVAVQERFVLLLRSDLLRRYPSALIYATRAIRVDGVRQPSIDEAQEAYPMFRGALPPDVNFFGFDIPIKRMLGGGNDDGYFIVIQEQPGEPRFGLDVGTDTGPGEHLRVSAGVPAGIESNGLQWGRNGAHVAGILRQQPVRVAIHASQFLLSGV